MTTDSEPRVMICFDHPSSDDAQSLIRQLDEDLLRRYPSLQKTHGLHPQDLLEPCIGQIKRMFVLPYFRRRGIARRILEALESKAHELGYTSVLLETGIGQPEAIGLYKSAGYHEIAGFGEYASNPLSVCLEKRLR